MRLVEIHRMQGKSVELRRKVGGIVYQAMVDTINVKKENWSFGNEIAQYAE